MTWTNKMTWANRITFFRILLVPVFIGLMMTYKESPLSDPWHEHWKWFAFSVFILASLSDALDGFLARHCGQQTRLGSIIDPFADKALMLTAVITLSVVPIDGHVSLPLWFVIVVVSRDILLISGVLVLNFLSSPVTFCPCKTGKAAMFFQLATILSAFISRDFTLWLCSIATGLIVVSSVIYFRQVKQTHWSAFKS